MYSQIYELYKKKTDENVMKKWEDYVMEIPSDVLNDINKYSPVKK